MAKKAKTQTYSVGSMEDYSSFVGSLSGANGKRSGNNVTANVTNISSLNLHMLKDLDEKIYLSSVKVEMNLAGDVSVFNVALLSPLFKRRGFKGRFIDLSIPSSLDAESKVLLKERICRFAKNDSVPKVKELLEKGGSISMDEGKILGFVDGVVDLAKKRGSNAGKSAVVSSEGNPAAENSTETK